MIVYCGDKCLPHFFLTFTLTVKAFCLDRPVNATHNHWLKNYLLGIIAVIIHPSAYCAAHHLCLDTLRASSAQKQTVRLHYLPRAAVAEELGERARAVGLNPETISRMCEDEDADWKRSFVLFQWGRNASITGERRQSVYSPFTSFIFHLNISKTLPGTSLWAQAFLAVMV